jgi:hypothetical protein
MIRIARLLRFLESAGAAVAIAAATGAFAITALSFHLPGGRTPDEWMQNAIQESRAAGGLLPRSFPAAPHLETQEAAPILARGQHG